MSDDDALSNARHAWEDGRGSRIAWGTPSEGFRDGFRAGLKHARQWRPLTEDPATWPEEGQTVAMSNAYGDIDARKFDLRVDRYGASRWTHWLPLSTPPVSILDEHGDPYRKSAAPCDQSAAPCDHGIAFDSVAARGLSAHEVRTRWPRLFGTCPKGCGFSGLGYASFEHYVAGDW